MKPGAYATQFFRAIVVAEFNSRRKFLTRRVSPAHLRIPSAITASRSLYGVFARTDFGAASTLAGGRALREF